MTQIFSQPWIRRLLLTAVCILSLAGAIALTSGQAVSEEVQVAQAQSLDADDFPANIEQGWQQRPDYGYSPYAGGRDFPQRVFWGDTHLHTIYSFDAGAAGARLTPEDSYRFARGEEVKTNTGQQIKISRPFDFLVVSDHTDGLGAFSKLLEGTPEIMADPQAKAWHDAVNQGGAAAAKATHEIIGSFSQGTTPPELFPTPEEYKSYWEYEVDTAEKYNVPGLFTALIGYEWTSLVTGDNLHRVVIYRDNGDKAKQLVPKTTADSKDPETLWAWMQNYEDQTGGRVLAIPHNGNLSNGLMFADTTLSGAPLTTEYAKLRQYWEPVYEATQTKGDGETHPTLSPTDEFADFETWDKGNLDLSQLKTPEMLPHEYARSGLELGLKYEEKLGENPFKFGMIGSTDSHLGISAEEENNYFGKFATEEPHPGRSAEVIKTSPDGQTKIIGWEVNAAGFAGVWARENTREAIWDAFRRREVYATTGPRMLVRFFGGWNFAPEDAVSRNPGDVGYEKGVPMGSNLTVGPAGKAPTFLVAALKDPIKGNIDRIQIIKGWLGDDGEPQEKVYDVVWSGNRKPGANGKLPAVGNTVNVDKAIWSNTIGAVELSGVWTDPDFDPGERAFYYARVLEIPTPHWTTYDHERFGDDIPQESPTSIQERIYTSPIWYSPV
ncbi:MAG: DUF3604 domain-containing protein [Oscillatoriales cyanobacterium RM2_1_1]|nr:DUF3604 domain-containing protein [Oscillatoriales cyanobacterium SM2_3_0]NJO44383.1 DUF3604 domain-containing protein [Oscillatoriales cyanobacterium RM2_1_1]